MVEKLKQKQAAFKQDYRTEMELYKKVADLKSEGFSGNISEESTYLRIKEEFDKFKELEEALKKYKTEIVNLLFDKKQAVIQAVTDARRKRLVELNKQEHRTKSKSLRAEPEVPNPQPAEGSSPSDSNQTPGVTPGSSGINVELIEKELSRENQLERAEKLVDYYSLNKKILEDAHDYYEEKLNAA